MQKLHRSHPSTRMALHTKPMIQRKSTVNTKFIATAVVAIAAMGSVSAFAQSQNHLYGEAALAINPVASTSTLTRAEVNAEYLKARQAGALPVSQEAAFAAAPAPATSSERSRAEVREEARHYVIMDGSNRKIYR